MLSIPPSILSMSFCYFQISTSVNWLIITVLRVAPIVQTLWGHSTAPVELDISGMELDVKVCFLNLWLALWECHFMEFWNHLEITVFLAVCLVFWAFIFSSVCVSTCSSFPLTRWKRPPKLRHENETKCEVALSDVQNKEPC